ncbi:MAG: ABC transporter permease [Gammaproteobacteria bacterium]|nr:MAG: ABC transporter permease [Gammaproteobacteria bacterium]
MPFNQQLIALRTIVVKEIRRFLRIWVQTIFPSAITMTLYFIIMGKFIGSQINDISGYSYIEFIAPGLIMMSIITNSYANSVSSFYSAKFQRHIEEMLVSPMPNYIIIIGFMLGGIARGVLVGVAVTIVALFFTQLQILNISLVIVTTILTSALFSLAGIINGVFANSFDDISIIPTFVLTPLTYLGGVFFSVGMLPNFWQNVSLANPILYMVNSFRFGILGITDVNLTTSMAVMIGFLIVLFSVCLYLLNKGIGIRS